MAIWNPSQYEKFRREREQPFHDLVATLRPVDRPTVIDLGCGTGKQTRVLHDRLAGATTVGIDSSEAMLAEAADCVSPGLTFEHRDIDTFDAQQRFDIVFSNAALHWIPDHVALFARLARALRPGGQLAVQVPYNEIHPGCTVAVEVAREPELSKALNGFYRVSPVLRPDEYATLLNELGFAEQDVTLRVYGHLLPSRAAVVEWLKGAYLTAYQRRLSADGWRAFLARYEERVAEVVPDSRPFFFPFRRILMWARLAG